MVLWSAAYFFFLLFGYFLLRPIRDEFGIRGDLDDLPKLWTATTVCMLLAAPVFAWLVSRMPRRRFIPLTYRFFAMNLLLFFAAVALTPKEQASSHLAIGYVFYVWLSVFNLFAVSIFWGFMADIFEPGQGKRLFGAIAVGGTLGATLGSSVPAFLSSHIGAAACMLIAACMLEVAVRCVGVLVKRRGIGAAGSPAFDAERPASPEPSRNVFAGFSLIARSPYLLAMVGYMLLYTLTSTFLYFEQARIVNNAAESPEVRKALFGRFDLATNILTLFVQIFLTGRVVSTLGIGAGLAVLPILTACGFAALWLAPNLAWPILLVFAVFQASRRALHHAIDRPTREMLYTPLGPDEKYKSKSFIDTFVYRGGDLLGAWAQAWKTLVAHADAVAIGLSALWLGVGLYLARRHVRELARRRPAE